MLLERVSGSPEYLVVEGESLGGGKERGLGLVIASVSRHLELRTLLYETAGEWDHTFPDRALE